MRKANFNFLSTLLLAFTFVIAVASCSDDDDFAPTECPDKGAVTDTIRDTITNTVTDTVNTVFSVSFSYNNTTVFYDQDIVNKTDIDDAITVTLKVDGEDVSEQTEKSTTIYDLQGNEVTPDANGDIVLLDTLKIKVVALYKEKTFEDEVIMPVIPALDVKLTFKDPFDSSNDNYRINYANRDVVEVANIPYLKDYYFIQTATFKGEPLSNTASGLTVHLEPREDYGDIEYDVNGTKSLYPKGNFFAVAQAEYIIDGKTYTSTTQSKVLFYDWLNIGLYTDGKQALQAGQTLPTTIAELAPYVDVQTYLSGLTEKEAASKTIVVQPDLYSTSISSEFMYPNRKGTLLNNSEVDYTFEFADGSGSTITQATAAGSNVTLKITAIYKDATITTERIGYLPPDGVNGTVGSVKANPKVFTVKIPVE